MRIYRVSSLSVFQTGSDSSTLLQSITSAAASSSAAHQLLHVSAQSRDGAFISLEVNLKLQVSTTPFFKTNFLCFRSNSMSLLCRQKARITF